MDAMSKCGIQPPEKSFRVFLYSVSAGTLAWSLYYYLVVLGGWKDPLPGLPQVAIMFVMFALALFAAASFSIVPFELGLKIARKYRIRHALFYMMGATLTASLLAVLFILSPALLGLIPLPKADEFGWFFVQVLASFWVGGVTAGSVCWWRVRTYFR